MRDIKDIKEIVNQSMELTLDSIKFINFNINGI